ncbi:MAG: hypothetical protein JNK11_01825 [Alphaproteobacteria bacterium]|nr:hypothetical protein [Alphaproteobacteria bacterium]
MTAATKRHSFATAAALLLALLAGACGPATWYPEPLRSLYDRESLSVAAKDGSVPTIVRGSPFGAAQAAFAETVTGLMKGQHFGPMVTFAPRDVAAPRAGYRVVMLFDSDLATGPEGLCGNVSAIPIVPAAAAPGTGAARTVKVAAAFCVGNRLMSTVFGQAAAAGPDDDAFRALVRQLTQDLFPPFNPEFNGQGNIKSAALF